MKPKITYHHTTEKLGGRTFAGLVYMRVETDLSPEFPGFTRVSTIPLAYLTPFKSDDTARKYAKQEAIKYMRAKLYHGFEGIA